MTMGVIMKKPVIIMFTIVLSAVAVATTIYIPEDYGTIQEGIEASSNGDEVIVSPGTYVEDLNYNGKAILVGSLFHTTQDTSYISETIIDGNQAGSVIIFESGEDTTSVLTGFTITNGNAELGGGIHCRDDSCPLLKHLIIESNIADGSCGGGGGIYCFNSDVILENVLITDNTSENSGGGIYCSSSAICLKDVILSYNNADHCGGGIHIRNSSTVSLAGVTVRDNSSDWGGGIYVSFNTMAIFDAENRCNIYLNNTHNRNNGSDIYSLSEINVIVDTFTVLNPSNFHASPIENFTFDILCGMQPQISEDLYVSPTGSNSNSGLDEENPLLTIQYASSIILADSLNPHTIHLADGVYSSANTGEFFPVNIPEYVTLAGDNQDTVILNAGGETEVSRIEFTENCSFTNLTITNGNSNHGGGICAYESCFSLENVTITNNYSNSGGGIYLYGSNLTLVNVTISNNSASNGAGIYCTEYSALDLYNVTITQNHTTPCGKGGGIYTDEYSSLNLENALISDNYADDEGGGVYCSSHSYPYLEDVVISNNSALNEGGGILCDGCSPELVNVMICNNSASTGGGINNKYSSGLSMSSVTITNNCAEFGGGIYCGYRADLVFNSEDRCSIFLNNTNNRGNGNDIYSETSLNVIVDTFTVSSPTDFHASPMENFTFDILEGFQAQIDADLYVSPSGNNINCGTTMDDPLKTIQYACSIILADSLNPHTIFLSEGIYSSSTNGEFFPVSIPDNVSLAGENEALVALDAAGSANVIRLNNVENVMITDITITNGYSTYGGGIYSKDSNFSLENITIIGNSTISYGTGGGIYSKNSNSSLTNVKILGNFAGSGGGIHCFNSILEIENVVIADNYAGYEGGGLFLSNSSSRLINVTILNNQADSSGGISCVNNALPILVNCIMWNNLPHEIELQGDYAQNSIAIAYSDIAGGENGIVNNNSSVHWLVGNIDVDPLFIDPPNENFLLSEDSPCIDTGTAFFEYNGEVLIDLNENEYIGIAPDMGAFEYENVNNDEFVIHNSQFKIHNYPNPFNPVTNIVFELYDESNIILEIYNIKGQKITTLANEHYPKGTHNVVWNASNQSSDVYLLRFTAEKTTETRKLVLLK